MGISWIPLLLVGIHNMDPTMGLLMTLTIAMTMLLIATALVAMTLTLSTSILGFWVIPALLHTITRLATAVVYSRRSASSKIKLRSSMAL